MAEQALEGIRVLDLSQGVYGYCGKLLADYGAEVIKVEKPGEGDSARRMWPFKDDDPHPEKGGLFLYLNTNKKSITLNLEGGRGRELFRKLVKTVDCVLESFPPGTLERLGLTCSKLERLNPRLVLTSMTPFGQTGPYRDYKGPDIVVQALDGAAANWGRAEKRPLKNPSYATDFFTASGAAMATLAAIWNAQETGEGQWIDVSSLDAQTLMTCLGISYYVYTGAVHSRRVAPFPGIMRCKNGFIGINLLTNQQWVHLCRLLGKEELPEMPEFATQAHRAVHAQELYEIFQPILMNYTAEELFHKGAGEMQIALGLVPRVDELPEMEQFKARGFFVEVEHPVIGKTRMPGAPFGLLESPWVLHSPAPLLGQHNREVYGALGRSDQDLVALKEAGVI